MNPIKLLSGKTNGDGSGAQQKWKPIRVSDVMSTGVLTLSADDSFDAAIGLMATHYYQYVIVTDDESKVIGVISQRDIIGSRSKITEWRTKRVRHAMRGNPVTVTFRTPLIDALSLMISEKVNCLPVTKANGVLCGILTSTDVIKSHLSVLAAL